MERRQRHIVFGLALLVALTAGAAAGIVASVSLTRSLSDYAAELFLSRTSTTTGGVSRTTPSSNDDAVARVADVARQRVAVITAASIDARGAGSWIAESDAVGYGAVVAADGWVLVTDDAMESFVNPLTQADVWIDGSRYAVTQVVADELTDFVLVKIDASGLTPAAFGASETVYDGSMVYAVYGTHGVFATSLVDGRATDGAPVAAAELYTFQWELTQKPAVSSPVFSSAGELLALSVGSGALPMHTGSTFVKSVLRDGIVSHAGLGALVVDLSLPLNMDATMSQGRDEGALVMAQVRNSPAQDVGILVGDVVTAVDDIRIDHATSLAELLRLYRPGDRATLTVMRDGASQRIDVTFGTYADLLY